MSLKNIIKTGISTLVNSTVINVLAQRSTDKVISIVQEHFTLSAYEIANAYQTSYSYALSAISVGLAAPEQKLFFFQEIAHSNLEQEFFDQIEPHYFQSFALERDLQNEALPRLRIQFIEQIQTLAKQPAIFQADDVPLPESELAELLNYQDTSAMTDLVLEQLKNIDENLAAFFHYNNLLGNAILFFFREILRKDERVAKTLAALQREGLWADVRDLKKAQTDLTTTLQQQLDEQKTAMMEAVQANDFSKIHQMSETLETLQQRLANIPQLLEQAQVAWQTNQQQFIEFYKCFENWTVLLDVKVEQVLAQMEQLAGQLDKVHDEVIVTKDLTQEVLNLLTQLMERFDLSPQVKPRDEFTQHSSNSLNLIQEALTKLNGIQKESPQYHHLAILAGSVLSSTGDIEAAENLFIQAKALAENETDKALACFNLFQVRVRRGAYTEALTELQTAITIDPHYALHEVEKYPIERLLGVGGMGCVFLCHDEWRENKVVVKCFWEGKKGRREDVFREVLIMRNLKSPYVLKTLSYGYVDSRHQERPYFVTEYIEGAQDGETWLAKHGQLAVNTGLDVGLQMAKGLDIAHKAGVYHLDLKPANLLLKQFEDKILLKIIDFGLAQVANSLKQQALLTQTRSGKSQFSQLIFGTLDYASPEQMGQHQYGKPGVKSDVFAFGATLYRLLTNDSPRFPHPRKLPDLPELQGLLLDCLEQQPDKRPDTQTLIEQLSGLLEKQKEIPPNLPLQKEENRALSLSKREQEEISDLKPGEIFRDRLKDGTEGPEMVIIPAGQFKMGDIQGNGSNREKPVHDVSVKTFAMGCYPVTVAEFRQFVEATGYQTEAEQGNGAKIQKNGKWQDVINANWHNPYFPQQDNQPVVCVSWHDAMAYIKWLSTQTRQSYRLPSEAEWEYAARAGTKTDYWWSNDIGKNRANCYSSGTQWSNKQTAPVNSFKPNQFGLYDTVGNVWEWCADFWHENYQNAPMDGSVWEKDGDNSRYVVRSGSWISTPGCVRVSRRSMWWHDNRGFNGGFRLARDINPQQTPKDLPTQTSKITSQAIVAQPNEKIQNNFLAIHKILKKLKVVQGDITLQWVDAIVNPTDHFLSGSGNADLAIHQAAGSELKKACQQLKTCAVGEAKITDGYNLPANFVIHTVGPFWQGGNDDENELLAQCYRNCLVLASQNEIKSIAFTAISTGAFLFPVELAAKIAVHEISHFLRQNDRIKKVILVCTEKTYDDFAAALEALKPQKRLDQTETNRIEKAVNDDLENVYPNGKIFRDRLQDGTEGPEMVIIPAGQFKMGDLQGNGVEDELPVHEVSVESFAIGIYPITFAEYDQFSEATGQEKLEDMEWGRGNRPIIQVSYYDAIAYVEWLSQQTGQQYRLPTEAEWEYAARAGTETDYWWGNEIDKKRAHYNGCGNEWDGEMTAPVGSFEPNPFGLYDTVGNVWEWTGSEYELKYSGKEQQLLQKPNDNHRIVRRSGAWYYDPCDIRVSYRTSIKPSYWSLGGSFRIVREIKPQQTPKDLPIQTSEITSQEQKVTEDHELSIEYNNRLAKRISEERRLPILGEGLAIDAQGQNIQTTAIFVGGAIKVGGLYQQHLTLDNLSEIVTIRGCIIVDSEHIDQKADIIAYCAFWPLEAVDDDPIYFLLDDNNKSVPWLNKDMTQYVPLVKEIRLESVMDSLPPYMGSLGEAGIWKIYFGYCLLEGSAKGTFVQNTKPIEVTVNENVQIEPSEKLATSIFRDRLKDGSEGPEMVIIPAGQFKMSGIQGTKKGEDQSVSLKVSVKSFTMNRFPVTFAEYDQFAEATQREKPKDIGWGRNNRPVINVTWEDAVAYAQWLSEQTGFQYRLPTEVEWEYAARAGTETNYWWGNKIGKNRANCRQSGSLWQGKKTAPVDFFRANPFGLYDMLGNVWEWTCSVYTFHGYSLIEIYNSCHRNWNQLPKHAFPTLRGGAWNMLPEYCRSAARYHLEAFPATSNVGFRLVREIKPKPIQHIVFCDRLLDGTEGPEMVIIPGGQFKMGDIHGSGLGNEQPVHEVKIKQLAISGYTITFAEYDNFAEATNRQKPKDEGWGRGNQPVIHVSWHDAIAYTKWLSQQTGQHYRLPTEAEWEYAARAGTETDYWWGHEIAPNQANCRESGSQWSGKQTAPVGSFAPNPFGLYDTVGNVWEWTCSEYAKHYQGKEQQGVPQNNLNQRVIRGGSWFLKAKNVRVSSRFFAKPTTQDKQVGFRIVREIKF